MTRERLSDRRPTSTITIPFGAHRLHVSFGTFADGPRKGELAEIFVAGAKTGSDVRLHIIEAITAASFALQHGATPEELLRALPRNGKAPEGALGLILEAWIALSQPAQEPSA